MWRGPNLRFSRGLRSYSRIRGRTSSVRCTTQGLLHLLKRGSILRTMNFAGWTAGTSPDNFSPRRNEWRRPVTPCSLDACGRVSHSPEKSHKRECQETFSSVGSVPTLFLVSVSFYVNR